MKEPKSLHTTRRALSSCRLRLFPLFILGLSFLLWPFQALSETLEMETQTALEVSGDGLTATITYTNKGTGPAHNIQAHIMVLDTQLDGPIRSQLNPGQSDTVSLEKDLSGIRKGRYPLTVRVDFHDANQYPFSALSGTTFSYQKDVNAELVVVGEDLSLEDHQALQFKVKNLADQARDIQARLVLPRELSVAKADRQLALAPRSEGVLIFEISNFSALPQAAYPIFCFLEYDVEEVHYTAVAGTKVKIVKKVNPFRRYRWVWVSLVIFLGALFLMGTLRDRKKKTLIRE